MQKVSAQFALGSWPFWGGVWLGIFGQTRCSLPKQTQLVIRILAAIPHPSPEDLVSSRYPVGVVLWIARIVLDQRLYLGLQLRRHHLICIERKNPWRGAFIDRRIHLRAVALPGFG